MATRIYCTGGGSPSNNWRESIVPKDMLYLAPGGSWKEHCIQLGQKVKIIYTGPYLIPGESYDNFNSRIEQDYGNIGDLCFAGIDSADVVFAWIEDCLSYRTFTEIGYAKGKNKTVWIGGNCLLDMRFIYRLADKVVWWEETTPLGILESNLPPEFDSPIEEKFWRAWEKVVADELFQIVLTYQCTIGKYRVDFACEYAKVAIELDGHATHSSPDAIAYDRKRQREIESEGWRVIRFGGKEVYADAYKCALEAHRIIYRILYPEANM